MQLVSWIKLGTDYREVKPGRIIGHFLTHVIHEKKIEEKQEINIKKA